MKLSAQFAHEYKCELQPWLALAGIITAVQGTACGIGLLLWCGMQYGDVIATVPFLVICEHMQA